MILILTAFGVMLGIAKPSDAMKQVEAFLGIVIVLIILPGIILRIWSGTSLWQQIGVAAMGIGVCIWLRSQRRRKRSKLE